MHTNEIKITPENWNTLVIEAEKLGERYVAALNEQIQRQNEKK